jgi:hydroxymethylbilane synthase
VRLRVATRGSDQARAQTEHIAQRFRDLTGAEVEIVLVQTTGDLVRDVPLAEIGGQGIFVKEVQTAVLEGRADVAVHSAKDLPSSWTAPGLLLASVPERSDPRDALVGRAVADLALGATVATGSARRQAQLAHQRPDLKFVGLRGNIPTRVAAAAHHDAVIVAVAGLMWVGLADHIAQRFTVDEMIPQIGQGALAIECRVDDRQAIEACRALENEASRRAVDTERAFLAQLGGGCELPVGAYATVAADGTVHLVAMLASADGVTVLRGERAGDGAHIGAELATELLSRGGTALLEEYR